MNKYFLSKWRVEQRKWALSYDAIWFNAFLKIYSKTYFLLIMKMLEVSGIAGDHKAIYIELHGIKLMNFVFTAGASWLVMWSNNSNVASSAMIYSPAL